MCVNLLLLTLSCVATGPPCTWPTCFSSHSILAMRIYFFNLVRMKSQLKPINSPIYVVMETRRAIWLPPTRVKWYVWARAKAVNKSAPQEGAARATVAAMRNVETIVICAEPNMERREEMKASTWQHRCLKTAITPFMDAETLKLSVLPDKSGTTSCFSLPDICRRKAGHHPLPNSGTHSHQTSLISTRFLCSNPDSKPICSR